MIGLARRVKEFFLGAPAPSPEETPAGDAEVARDCSFCPNPATRIFYYVRTQIETPIGTSETGSMAYACDDECCIEQGRAESSLRTEEYPWPHPQATHA